MNSIMFLTPFRHSLASSTRPGNPGFVAGNWIPASAGMTCDGRLK
jgi:hypothetical protein